MGNTAIIIFATIALVTLAMLTIATVVLLTARMRTRNGKIAVVMSTVGLLVFGELGVLRVIWSGCCPCTRDPAR